MPIDLAYEARKEGERIYNGNSFRIVMVPSGRSGDYDIAYETTNPGSSGGSNGRNFILAEGPKINLLDVLEIE